MRAPATADQLTSEAVLQESLQGDAEILPPLPPEGQPQQPSVRVTYTAAQRSENARLAARDKSRDEKGLTKRQALLVDLMLTEGLSATQAAIRAGYRPGRGASVNASRTLALPKVQAYLMEQVNAYNARSTVRAVRRMRSLVDHAKSEFVQMQASQDILERAGIARKPVLDSPSLSIDIDLG
jgi:hypothetical protein